MRPSVPVIVAKGDDAEFEISHISAVCIKLELGRQGKCLLFMTHFMDDDTPLVWHRLNEEYRTTA
jgi:hypothetical protein